MFLAETIEGTFVLMHVNWCGTADTRNGTKQGPAAGLRFLRDVHVVGRKVNDEYMKEWYGYEEGTGEYTKQHGDEGVRETTSKRTESEVKQPRKEEQVQEVRSNESQSHYQDTRLSQSPRPQTTHDVISRSQWETVIANAVQSAAA